MVARKVPERAETVVIPSQAAALQLSFLVFVVSKGVPDHIIGVLRHISPSSQEARLRASVVDGKRPVVLFRLAGRVTLSDHDRFDEYSWTPLVCCGASI
jgi:hypothetical protein